MPYVADEFTGRTFGKYEVLCRIAVGGMAEIFLAFARSGPFAYKPVVLKRILAEQREDNSAMQMLIDEARITATLNHENVARVLDLELAGDEVLLVIEFIGGATLDELVQLVLEKKEVVPLGFVLTAILDCAQGLHHAHSHKDAAGKAMPIIHRDVTPKNLMVDFDGVGKVLDFGIARAIGAARRTVAGMVRGTSAYMSPEQAIDGKMDIRTDIFSLGTIFHELLTGQRLFLKGNAAKEMAAVYEAEVPAPSQVNRRVPKALDAVVLKALERPLTRRYQTALELVRDVSLAASSTAWTRERCGELVRNRFARRREEVLKLIPDRRGQTATLQVSPDTSDTDEHRRPDDQAVPTRFFTPSFDTLSDPPEDNPRPDPETRAGNADSTVMIKAPEPLTSPSTQGPIRRRSPKGISRLGVAIAAAGALAVGAVGGIVIHKSLGERGTPASTPAQGLGRLSIETDRNAEVQLGPNMLARTPIVDVWLSSGKHQFKLREADGPWLALEVDILPDRPTRLKVRLDTLKPVAQVNP